MTWCPGWRQWRLPVASYTLLLVVAVRNGWGVEGVGLGLLTLVIAWRDFANWRRQTGLAGVLLVPDTDADLHRETATGEGASVDREVTPVASRVVWPVLTRVRWFLRSWLVVDVEYGIDRHTLHLFGPELTAADFAAVNRWVVREVKANRRHRDDPGGGRTVDR